MKLLVLAVVVASAAAVPRERRQAPEPYVKCNNGYGECVPYYLCRDNKIVTDGSNLIDIRVGSDPNNPRTSNDCLGFLEVCCGGNDFLSTTTTTTPQPVIRKCGQRNHNGIDVHVTGLHANQTQFGEFPWMAAVLRKEQTLDKEINLYQCGGVLIAEDVVLTAAHCVAKSTASELRVRLGEWDTQREYEAYPHQDRDVVRVVIHEGYNEKSLFNDFALLFLAYPVELAPHINTVCLTEDLSLIENSGDCVVTGWGKDRFGDAGVFQNVLKKIPLPYVPQYACQDALRTSRLGQYFILDPSFLCYGGLSTRDACQGDGGSPMVCRVGSGADESWVLGGLVAWGIGCHQENLPGVYANTVYANQWINSYLIV